MTELPYTTQLVKHLFLVCYGLASAGYVRVVGSRTNPGFLRLLLFLLPVVFNVVLPYIFDPSSELLSRIIWAWFLTWIANFKMLAFAFGRGTLSVQRHTYTQFVAILLLPIYPVQDKKDENIRQGRLFDSVGGGSGVHLCLKIVFLGLLVFLQLQYDLPRVVKDIVQVAVIYLHGSALVDCGAAFFRRLLGLEIIPNFDKPWLSSSISEFWSRRWNITNGTVLRVAVYDPIIQGSLLPPTHPVRPSQTCRALALCAVFLVSGLLHEYVIWMVTMDGVWRWKQAMFFTMQGPLVLLETRIKQWAKARNLSLNVWLARVLTLTILMFFADLLFISSIDKDTDIGRQALKVYASFYAPFFPKQLLDKVNEL